MTGAPRLAPHIPLMPVALGAFLAIDADRDSDSTSPAEPLP